MRFCVIMFATKIIMKGIKAIVGFAVLAVLFLIPPSTHAEGNIPTLKAGESVPAPFGLRWGMTCDEVIALGAKGVGKRCALFTNLPKGLKGFEALLRFEPKSVSASGIPVRGLVSVSASNSMSKDRNIHSSRRIVKELLAALVAKYGKGNIKLNTPENVWISWEFEDGSDITLTGSFSFIADTPGLVLVGYRTKDSLSYKERKDKIEAEL